MAIKIISINANGLQNEIKRRTILNYARNRADIICLQETHTTIESESLWKLQWRGEIFFSHGQVNKRGVAILIKDGLDVQTKLLENDNEGRRLSIILQQQDFEMVIVNLYAPNQDEPSFFVHTLDKTIGHHENIMYIGDFNVAMNPEIDRKGKKHNNKNSCEILNAACEEHLLIDIWRVRNEGVSRYSYIRKKPLSASRIDYSLITAGLETKIASCFYIPCASTDHSAYYCSITFQKQSRGRGYWKFNNSLLEDSTFVEKMNMLIDQKLAEYNGREPIEKWELLKFEISNFSQDWSREKSNSRKLIISQLYEKLAEMEDECDTSDEKLLDLIDRTKADIADLEAEVSKGILFRCRAKWQVEAERNTKYFYSLEKSKYDAKTCASLIGENGHIERNPNKILKMQRDFYRKLYAVNKKVRFKPPTQESPKITKEEKHMFEQKITIDELATALKQMKPGKTPGSDGLSVDFYKIFFNRLQDSLHQCLLAGLERKKLHDSARRGVISLIPKPKKDSRRLKHLRPISLLNVDLKLLEKAVANRIDTVIDKLIHHHQKGFLKARRISSNILKVLEIIRKTKDSDIDGLILSVDFSKCFDKISFSAIFGALQYFGFGPEFIDMIRTMYSNFTACIQNNGSFSDPFPILQGVRQGAPNSSYMFLLCAEIMAIMIRSNRNIQGIPVADITYLLSQYADDFDTFSRANHSSVQNLFKVLNTFQQISGFTINYDKTTIYRIGSIRNTNAKCYVEKQVNWTNDPINILGVVVHDDENVVMKENYQPILLKAKSILNQWNRRKLSLIGKIQIVNTLVASLFYYRMSVIRSIHNKYVMQFDQMVQSFLWDGGRSKIKKHILECSINQGGLKLVNILKRDQALKIAWIQIVRNDTEMENLMYDSISKALGEQVWRCNLDENDVELIMPQDSIWKDVLSAWAKVNYQRNTVFPRQQIVWWNSRIRIGNSPILWERCLGNGLTYVGQLYPQGSLLSAKTALDRFGLNVMNYNSLISAIPQEWRKICRNSEGSPVTEEGRVKYYLYDSLITKKYFVSVVYNLLIDDESALEDKRRKWEKDLNTEIQCSQFIACFKNIYRATNITKLRSFQYRLLQRSLITNVQLNKWNIKSTDKCTFCQRESETVLHLLIYCPVVAELWVNMELFMNTYNKDPIHFAVDTVLTNRLIYQPVGHIKNAICLMVKYFIYRQRCFNQLPNIHQCKQYIWSIENNEKYYAIKNNNLQKHLKKWSRNQDDNNSIVNEFNLNQSAQEI